MKNETAGGYALPWTISAEDNILVTSDEGMEQVNPQSCSSKYGKGNWKVDKLQPMVSAKIEIAVTSSQIHSQKINVC